MSPQFADHDDRVLAVVLCGRLLVFWSLCLVPLLVTRL